MAEYIEKGATVKALQLVCLYDSGTEKSAVEAMNFAFHHCKEKIAAMPAADVAPVRHGKWIGEEVDFRGSTAMECSCCHKVRIVDEYCPSCGARMDG